MTTLTAPIRASLFNLIIYTKKEGKEEYLQKLVKNIVRKYPCRVIFITEFGEGNFLNSSISEMQPNTQSHTPIVCDIINMDVAGDHLERVPFAILSQLLADRPVYLLWGDDPTKESSIAYALENCATRTVFDSARSDYTTDFAKTLLYLHDNVTCDIGDLNWARGAPWRSLFAETFNSKERLSFLQKARDIQIVYNTGTAYPTPHAKIKSVYFQAWLAIKLGWRFEAVLGSGNEIAFRYQSDNDPIRVVLTPGKRDDLPSGRIIQIEISSDHTEHMLFSRAPNHPNKVAIQRTTTTFCEMPVYHMFGKEDIGRSMIFEIYSQGTSNSFLSVLQLLSKYPREVVT